MRTLCMDFPCTPKRKELSVPTQHSSQQHSYGWCNIPPHMMARKDFTHAQKMLFGKILGLITKDGYCFASNEWLGEELNLRPKAVSNTISRLVSLGFLRRELLRNEKKEIIQRRLFPFLEVQPDGEGIPQEKIDEAGIPIHPTVDRGIHCTVEGTKELLTQRSLDIGSESHTEKEKDTLPLAEAEAQDWLDTFNARFDKHFRSVGSFIALFLYWRKIYSLEEMKQAAHNAWFDEWWRNKITPEMFFRKKNPRMEPVDYIGKFLNMDTPREYGNITDWEEWAVARDTNVHFPKVHKLLNQLRKEIAAKTFHGHPEDTTLAQVLRRAVDQCLSRGEFQHCTEFEAMDLDLHRPDNVALYKQMREEIDRKDRQ